jgi:alpha-D-xyloside xylohydrolase
VIAPSTDQMSVYLPQNPHGWFDFWTGEDVSGSATLTVGAKLYQIPLFVPAGSILPFGPKEQYVSEKGSDPIELRIYPGADATFTLYEDEGTNYNYEHGAFSTIQL